MKSNDTSLRTDPSSPSAFRVIESEDDVNRYSTPTKINKEQELALIELDSCEPSPPPIITHSLHTKDNSPPKNDEQLSEEDETGCCTWLFKLLIKRCTRQHSL